MYQIKIQKLKNKMHYEKEKTKHLNLLLRRYYSLLNEKNKAVMMWEKVKENMDGLAYEENKGDAKILRMVMLKIDEEYKNKDKKINIQEELIKKELKSADELKKTERILHKIEFSLKKKLVLKEVMKNLPSDFVVVLGLFFGGFMFAAGNPFTSKIVLSCAGISFILVAMMRAIQFMNESEQDPIYKIYDENYLLILRKIRDWFDKNAQK